VPYESVVLAKQVPDTAHITGQAMKADGTVNRAALPAIFNPDDLAALELALGVKDQHGGHVTVISMGPPSAAAVLREALWRGADRAVLLTDRKAAGSDTLATSYLLARAVRHAGAFDLVFCGRQAIDGDTAQVGPQVAEKLGLPQITYAERIDSLAGGRIEVTRGLPLGVERVRCPLPCLLTVNGAAITARPPSARRVMAQKLASTRLERQSVRDRWPDFDFGSDDELDRYLAARGLAIPIWAAADVGAEDGRIGLDGSPTKVAKVDYVVLEGRSSTDLEATPEAMAALMSSLVQEYVL
jgi:electron transfer flavoprotein beta subunit